MPAKLRKASKKLNEAFIHDLRNSKDRVSATYLGKGGKRFTCHTHVKNIDIVYFPVTFRVRSKEDWLEWTLITVQRRPQPCLKSNFCPSMFGFVLGEYIHGCICAQTHVHVGEGRLQDHFDDQKRKTMIILMQDRCFFIWFTKLVTRVLHT